MRAGAHDQVALDLPARPEYLALVRSVVTAVARSASKLPSTRVDDLRLAVTEACANAIDASARVVEASSSGRFHVRCELDGEGVVVEVQDHAGGFDPAGLAPPPSATRSDRLKYERGLGIPLMRTVTDGVEFRHEGGGTTVRLTINAAERTASSEGRA